MNCVECDALVTEEEYRDNGGVCSICKTAYGPKDYPNQFTVKSQQLRTKKQ